LFNQVADKRFVVVSENTRTGEMEKRHEYNEERNAKIAKALWHFGSYIGWIIDTETGAIY
jgi:hypothetical protein